MAARAPSIPANLDQALYSDEKLLTMDRERRFVIPSPKYLESIQEDAAKAMSETFKELVSCYVCELDCEPSKIEVTLLTESLLKVDY